MEKRSVPRWKTRGRSRKLEVDTALETVDRVPTLPRFVLGTPERPSLLSEYVVWTALASSSQINNRLKKDPGYREWVQEEKKAEDIRLSEAPFVAMLLDTSGTTQREP